MASTRNKNTISDYRLQQDSYEKAKLYNVNEKTTIEPKYLVFGLNPHSVPNTKLSFNPTDIESQLFGIGSTNLVRPKEPVGVEFKHLEQENFIDRVELIIPKLETLNNQRPQFK